jgi:hypothetical protein
MRFLRVIVALAILGGLGWFAWDDWITSDDDAATSSPTTSPTTAKPTPTPSPTPVATLTPVKPAKGTLTTTFRKGAAMLKVVPEDRQAYLRSYFGKGWIDANKNCRDTRQEVLARLSLVPVGKACKIYQGKWLSYYDNKTWTKSFQVQIDHLVPLAEAWDSGAYQWNLATRVRFANDLDDLRELVPTTTALNYSKVADDPQWYVPKVNACRYISSWVAVKLRWNMTVDQREKAAIDKVVKKCPDAKLTVKRAPITLLPFAAGNGTRSTEVKLDSISYKGKSEKVVLKNRGKKPVTLTGWVITDEIGYGQYRMPKTVVPAGATLTVVSTKGSKRIDKNGNIVMYANWGDVWNNSGDIATLIDGRRKVTDTCRYVGNDSGKARC